MEKNVEILRKYLPEKAAPLVATWIDHLQVELKINRPRESVLGDYRHPHGQNGHRISINNDLNPYAFLITLVHEFAHLIAWNKFRNQVRPHGNEWKQEFKRLMQPFFDRDIFPEKIKRAVITYLRNPGASSCTDVNLLRVLKEYDVVQHTVFVSAIPHGGFFSLKNGRKFQKLQLIRKRYHCKEIPSGKIYLFSPVVEVYVEPK